MLKAPKNNQDRPALLEVIATWAYTDCLANGATEATAAARLTRLLTTAMLGELYDLLVSKGYIIFTTEDNSRVH